MKMKMRMKPKHTLILYQDHLNYRLEKENVHTSVTTKTQLCPD